MEQLDNQHLPQRSIDLHHISSCSVLSCPLLRVFSLKHQKSRVYASIFFVSIALIPKMVIHSTTQNSVVNIMPIFSHGQLETCNKTKTTIVPNNTILFFPPLLNKQCGYTVIKSQNSSSSHYAEEKIFNEILYQRRSETNETSAKHK